MAANNGIEQRSAAIKKLRESQSKPYMYDKIGKFIDYWFGLPKTGLMPDKSAIEPRSIMQMLPGVIMLESANAPGHYRIRLFGTANAARWGFEATGAEYLDFAAPQQHKALVETFSQLHKQPCGVILNGDELYTSGRVLRNEMALFPVRTDTPGQEILFGLIIADAGTVNGEDTLASVFYTINKVHYVNIGAGIPG